MALTRRQLLKRGGLLGAGGALAPSIFASPLVRSALATQGTRYVVIVYLDGGNDGLNTVTPLDDGSATLRQDYAAARTTLGLSTGSLLEIGGDPGHGAALGIHPALAGLRRIQDDFSCLALIQGCGYPDYSLSHQVSRVKWASGLPLPAPLFSGGWFGRYLVHTGFAPTEIPGVAISDNIPGELIQNATSILTLEELDQFGFPYDYDFGDDDPAKRAAFQAICAQAALPNQPFMLRYLGNSGTATLGASDVYPSLDGLYVTDRAAFDAMYESLATPLANDLREVAKIVYGAKTMVPGIDARFFQVSQDGYDTHADQENRHRDLLSELGGALEVFYRDLVDMGIADDTLIVVWSEFSRRIQQNETGTDHGSQGPMLVIGGSVNGGVYGNHPDISAAGVDANGNTVYSQSDANLYRSTDFRDIYGTIFKHWLGLTEGAILTSLLHPDPGTSDAYWVAGKHDFDLGFL